MNVVAIRGKVCSEVESKQAGGWTIKKFNVSVCTRYDKKKKEGVYGFFTVKTFNDAEVARGQYVIVYGKLDQDRWESKDGKKQERTFVLANEIYAFDFKPTRKEFQDHSYDGEIAF
jgi:single-stranded DNA-binding protein